ncbi:MAG: hypothetical protein AAFU71_12055, partial [Cyanobacteria bacterium J06632_22]
MYLQAKADTIFKTSPKQSATLPEGEKLRIEKGEVFDILEHQAHHLHVKFTLIRAPRKAEERLTWYAYKPDINVFGAPGVPVLAANRSTSPVVVTTMSPS